MPLFKIDDSICSKCGNCVRACPASFVEIDSTTGFPVPAEYAEAGCINCGHCVASCPVGALSLERMPVETTPVIKKELEISVEQMQQFMRSRRSIRSYKKQNVARDVIEQLIDIARYAQSGHNIQPVNWLVVHDTEKVNQLAGLVAEWMRQMVADGTPLAKIMHFEYFVNAWDSGADCILRSAPHLVIAYGKESDGTAPSACAIALTWLEMAAPTLELGTCWAGLFEMAAAYSKEVKQALQLPDGFKVFSAAMLGQPALKYHRMPDRNRPKITWL